MAYCGNCGAQLRDDMPFCSNCGAANPEYVQTPYYGEETSLLNEQPDYGYRDEAPAPTQGTNGLAIAGMVLAFCFAPVGIILSAIALKRARSGDYRNPLEGLAKAGLIVSIICTVLGIVYLCLLAAMGSYILSNGGIEEQLEEFGDWFTYAL